MYTSTGRKSCSRVRSSNEVAQANASPNRAQYLAGRFAAKEAVLKALGVGWAQDVAWTDVEIHTLASGAPAVT
ncbi:MAG: 4'-phosphopantetheinyl transferase superfamily protein [Dehalococcoidia bacterium]